MSKFDEMEPSGENHGALVANFSADLDVDSLAPAPPQAEMKPPGAVVAPLVFDAQITPSIDIAKSPLFSGGTDTALEQSSVSDAVEASDLQIDGQDAELIARYPSLLRHQTYRAGSSPWKIVKLLNGQIRAGGLERSRGGKISRSSIANQLGWHDTNVTQYLDILLDYEKATGGTQSVHEAKIPAMRAWFEGQMRAGSLQVRAGSRKASRKQFLDAFDLPNSASIFLRYPRIAALVDEFDEKIRVTGYSPADVSNVLEKLKAILADDPPIAKDGKSINRKAVGDMLGISAANISRPPFADLFIEPEKTLLASVQSDPLIAFTGGRLFKFHVFVEQGWTKAYAIRLRNCFQRGYRKRGKDEARAHFAILVELMAFIAGASSQHCRSLLHGLGNGVPVKSLETELTKATQDFRDHLRETFENTDTCNNRIILTNTVVRKLSADGVLPQMSLYLIEFRNDSANHLPSYAEARPTGSKKINPSVDDYLAFALSMLNEAAEASKIETVVSEQGDFLRALREELEAEPFTSADNPSKLILRILNRRVDLIYAAAWKVVQQGQRDLERGKELLQRAVEINDEELAFVIGEGQPRSFERDERMRRSFPVGDGMEQGIANLLMVVKQRYDGIYPVASTKRVQNAFFAVRALEYGGVKKLQAYLMPSKEVVSAVLTLYLLESGSNVSVGRTLYLDCIEPSDTPGHIKVTGYKARAAGKPIFAVFPETSEAAIAMKWLHDAVALLTNVEQGDRNFLFVTKARGEKVKLIEEYGYRADFKRLVKVIPEFAGLSMNPNMTRPTILLRAALEEDGVTTLSQAIGQHGQRVHEGYVNKYPLRYLRDTEVRYFQRSLETVVIQKIKEAHDFLGVDLDGMSGRVEAVMRTGLGTLCGDRNGRPGSDGSPCTSVDCWNNCPQLIVIAKKEEVAILQIWQHSLRLVEGDWIQHQPERWEAVWLPWLCFVDAVEVKMRQSFGAVWRAASVISKNLINQPNFQPVRLF
ncbi:hypothetical protein HFO27_23455 [Rhizobium leguminosarum]|uniref:hypothetical protein n=1 Tax=Rhizobium leguminosarum TaxID=384 RepID=UPI001C9029E6|nr:hypothetical protein [Rhizobium leguminosarum]MBY3177561.1 hypothetical protein [Rhizobium leguminosarum]